MNGLRVILKTVPVLFWFIPNQAEARLVSMPSYQEMLAKSDLVVIANPITTTADTREHSFLPNIWRQEKNGEKNSELNGPILVYFDPSRPSGRGSSYLLFLVREPDGRYSPVGGQTDPGLGSISPIPFGFH